MTAVPMPKERIVSCGDISCEFLVDPIPRPTPPQITVTSSPVKREVVLIDNQKPGSMEILRGAQQILRERGVAVRDEIRVKLNASVPLDDPVLDELAAQGGLILCGVAD